MLLKVVPSIPNDEIAIRLLSDQARLELEDALQALTHAGLKGVEVHVVVGNSVARSILDFATRHSADVIAMTTKGRGASRMFVGSIADKVLRATTLPMLLVRPLTGGEHALLDADAVAAQLPALTNV